MTTVYELASLIEQYRRLETQRSPDAGHLALLLDRQVVKILDERERISQAEAGRAPSPPPPQGRMKTGPSKLVIPNPQIRLYEGD